MRGVGRRQALNWLHAALREAQNGDQACIASELMWRCWPAEELTHNVSSTATPFFMLALHGQYH